jgi:radical SAM protein with 4Fe4S-binding SPASM domain
MPSKMPHMERGFIYPHVLKLQWHITDRCNLRCAHCYQDTYNSEDLSYSQLLGIFEQYKGLIKQLNCESPFPVHGHMTITGGEPFIRKDFLDLLEGIHDNKEHIGFAILTNGILIDAPMASKLRELNASFVQVSIEGSRDTNDTIRGPGAFERTVSALRHLVRERVHTFISFTAHQKNFFDFPAVARLGLQLEVTRVWSDRLIPWGNGSALESLMLSPDQTRRFFKIMHTAHGEALRSFCRTEIAMHRALQFLLAGGTPYHCGAGHTLITVQPNGDLYPCRRMPVRIGNLLEDSLVELYYKNSYLRALRDPIRISKGCEQCSFSKKCRGGLKCLSYAITGDPFTADPGCWLASRCHGTEYPAGLSFENVRAEI